MFIYENNETTKAELKKLLIDKGVTAREVAERMGVKQQQYNNIINKKNLSLSDLNRIAAALGCKLAISFVG